MNPSNSGVFGIYSWEVIMIIALERTRKYNFVIQLKNYQLPQYIYHFEGIEVKIKLIYNIILLKKKINKLNIIMNQHFITKLSIKVYLNIIYVVINAYLMVYL